MLELLSIIFAAFVFLFLLAWAIAYICSFGFSGFRVMVSEFSGYSVNGFSALRLAYYFTFTNAMLTPLHWLADWRGDEAIMVAGLILLVATVVACCLVSRSSGGRFLPVAFSVLLAINHSFLCKA
jgi:hypothetical protein